VEGESLRDRLKRERQLPVEEALRLAMEVGSALAYAHAQGVIHRDIKPENILLSNNQAVVADFGIARAVSLAGGEQLTETGVALGTPQYMSPEQATGDRSIDSRSDIYALGCVLYEMLAGEPPFTGPTAQSVVAKSLSEPAPPVRKARPSVSPEIERVIARGLAKLPADRYTSAAAFGEALAGAAAAPAVLPDRTDHTRVRNLVLLILAGIGVIAALLFRQTSSPGIIAPATSIAVLPFTPSGTDTALSRLGRDLVYTLSAELDGLGGIRVVDAHTVLARARPEGLGATPDWTALGRSFGAGSIVHGSLVRMGPAVRLDFALFNTDSAAAPLARATITAPPDSLAALTDSAAKALLAQVWSRGSPPTPSLDAALRTRSVAALRWFLQGEGELTRGDWESAARSYLQAMEADPGFWLAYARQIYARYWSLHEPEESVLVLLDRHRFELPERERLSTEAILLQGRDSIGVASERARIASERYPDSWFGWLIYGDMMLHDGPFLGRSPNEGRAFERALSLNPNLIPAWEHLMLLATLDRDTAAAAGALQALQRLNAGPVLSADGYGNRILQFRFLLAIARGDSAIVDALTDSIARDPAPAAVPWGSFYDPICFGFFGEQVRVSQRALLAGGSPERRRTHRLLLAMSWGGLGDWDSALVNLERSATEEGDSLAALRAYGLAALGVWLGAVDPRDARSLRAQASAQGSSDPAGRAELAWIDGVIAAARRQPRELGQARAALRQSNDPAVASLDRSLGALEQELRGATRKAGDAMASLEWEQAKINAPDFADHPWTIALDRLAGSRWLSASGRSEEALRLLRWVDGPFLLHPSAEYGLMFAALVHRERQRIEEERGKR
jgi:TolB-like protein